jgi:hypothetical protein
MAKVTEVSFLAIEAKMVLNGLDTQGSKANVDETDVGPNPIAENALSRDRLQTGVHALRAWRTVNRI